MVAFRLNALGWTHEEISDALGMSKPNVAKIFDTFSNLEKVSKNLLSEGHPHLEVAERHNLPLQMVWAGLDGQIQAAAILWLDVDIVVCDGDIAMPQRLFDDSNTSATI